MLTEKVKAKLEDAFPGADVEVMDTSGAHAGHNPSGAHIAVQIVYSGFEGKSLIEQHQMINKVLAEELKQEIHALQIKTRTN